METPDIQHPELSDSKSSAKVTRKVRTRKTFVPIGFILVLAAWLLMMLLPWVSMGCVCVGLIFSIVGLQIPAGARRNLAITSVVAGSVLVLVYAIFIGLFVLI